MKNPNYIIFAVFIAVFALVGIGASNQKESSQVLDSLQIRKQFSESPVYTALESMKMMEMEEGFEVKLVVEEPLLNSPVAMVFDKQNRIWVAEMEGYMPDTAGTGEEQPKGRIVILRDKNGNGVMDSRTVFLESLLLPRALCLIENGILVAESPKLWFYEIKDDKPVKKILVDSTYAEGGNVEHQPNGLFRALDNWIYNAKSAKRYRKKGDSWEIERTHFRGQWGISQDDQGRLFYNTNSENLLGDLFGPGFGSANTNQQTVSGFNKRIVASNKVYPARATTGVNRGYQPGVLDDSLRLVNFTAACGPVVYNGHLFGNNYRGNAFVAEPSANLIKRNIIQNNGYQISGKQAYAGREFLRSTDERFRPVNLYNGPDGALYIIDMYRGIIQHKTYLTPYLKNEIKERDLTEPLTFGRIYKIVPKSKKSVGVKIEQSNQKLIRQLGHENGWVRSMAQQLLVDSRDQGLAPYLRKFIESQGNSVAISHALWTLEGIGALHPDDILNYLKASNWELKMQAFGLARSVINKNNYREFLTILNAIVQNEDAQAAPYAAFLASEIRPFNATAYKNLLLALSKKFGSDVYVSDAIISNLKDQESEFYGEIIKVNPDTSFAINKRLKKVIDDIQKAKTSKMDLAKDYPRGSAIFKTFCQTCHGADGNGVTSLAPPLNNSEWVTGDKSKLNAIVLYGLTGPIKIGNKLYKSPEINGEMPGIAANTQFSDQDIAELLNYIRNSWNNKGEKVDIKDVTSIRNKFKGRQKPFTMVELNAF